MREQKRERFKELCEHAEVVDDPEKLAKIASQVGRILESEVDELKKHARVNTTVRNCGQFQKFYTTDELVWYTSGGRSLLWPVPNRSRAPGLMFAAEALR